MLLSAVSILVVAQSSSEIPEGLMNNPVLYIGKKINFYPYFHICYPICLKSSVGNLDVTLLSICELREHRRIESRVFLRLRIDRETI